VQVRRDRRPVLWARGQIAPAMTRSVIGADGRRGSSRRRDPAPVGGRSVHPRLKDDRRATRPVALDVELATAHIDESPRLRGVAFTHRGRDGGQAAADREDHQDCDHRYEKPPTTASEVGADLDEHPDREGGDHHGPHPTEEVHGFASGPDHDKRQSDEAEDCRGKSYPGLRLRTEACRGECHHAPADTERQQDRPGDHRLGPARGRAKHECERKRESDCDRADDGRDRGTRSGRAIMTGV
jgi:hypothetical protein